jgi:septal ring factor EnvC (AmiA/AmiB activator)
MVRGARRARALAACAAGALLIFLGTADAQTRRTAAQVERDRRAEAARAEQLRGQAEAVRREMTDLDARLVEAGRRRGDAEAAALVAEARLAALLQQADVDAHNRAQARRALEDAVIAAAFARRRIEPSAARTIILARAAAPAFAAAERDSARALVLARDATVAVAAEQLALAEAKAAIDRERAEIETLLDRRRAAQDQLASDAAAAERRVSALAAEARTLRELAQRLEAARRRGRSGAGAAAIPAAWLPPAEGRITRGFGVRDGAGPASQGVIVRTRAGAQVVSPAPGEVAYAGLFRSYGQVLILNLDGGYVLVLTGLESISARVGESVRAGQPLGEMAPGVTPAPELYVEVRRDGRPVDPGRWLSARGLAAEQSAQAG